MKLCISLLVALSLEGAFGADRPLTVTAASSGSTGTSRDTGVVTLPGAPARTVAPPQEAPAEAKPEAKPEVKPELKPEPKPAPVQAKVLPDAFKEDSSLYLQKVIGVWKKGNARALLGEPVRQRVAYDDKKAPEGQILAFRDPSGKFKELELDFDNDSGALRTVFAYPKEMTWEECLKIWGANVNTNPGQNGRTFYSYLNRKLDVLVAPGGKVISLGLY